MVLTRFDDTQADALADYICDYIDGMMDPVIVLIFEDYIASYPTLAEFVSDATSGKKALMQLRDVNNEEDVQ